MVVLADWLGEEEKKSLAAFLKKRLAQTPNRERVTFVVVRGVEPIPLPPVRTAAQLEKELALALEAGPDGEAARPAAEQVFDLLLGMAPEPEEAWRDWIWAGRIPMPEQPLVRQYLGARLRQVLGNARLRMEIWPAPDGDWPTVREAGRADRLHELEFDVPPAAEGFELLEAEVEGPQWPVISQAAGFRLPAIAELAEFLRLVEAASGSGAEEKELAGLQRALAIFPNYLPALEAGATLGERLGDFRSAAFFLARLAARRSGDAAILRRYAAAAWRARLPEAESALRRALQALPQDAELLEWLGRARIAAGDNREAYAWIRRSLEERPDNATLWWIAADLARELGDASGERTALRQALDREPGRADRRARLVILSLQAGDGPVLKRTLEEADGEQETDIAILEQYAVGWEALGEPGRALRLWTRTVALQAGYEKGHLAVCRLLEARGDWAATLEAAERGLSGVPASAGLHLARAKALWNIGRHQDSRRALRNAAAIRDIRLAEARAETEDLFGGPGAVEAWRELLAQLEEGGADPARKDRFRQRAVRSALRDGNPEAAARYLQLPELPPEAASQPETGERGLLIPGGVAVLRFLSGIGGPDDPGEYLTAFARAVVQRSLHANEKEWERYYEPLLDHYDKLMQLRRPFPLTHGGTEIVLSAESQKQRQQTQRVLELLGYRLRTGRGRLSIEIQTKGDRARRHDRWRRRWIWTTVRWRKLWAGASRGEPPDCGRICQTWRFRREGSGGSGAAQSRTRARLCPEFKLRDPTDCAGLRRRCHRHGSAVRRRRWRRTGLPHPEADGRNAWMLPSLHGPATMTPDEQGRRAALASVGGGLQNAVPARSLGESPRNWTPGLPRSAPAERRRRDAGDASATSSRRDFRSVRAVSARRPARADLPAGMKTRRTGGKRGLPAWRARASIVALFRELPLDEDGSVHFSAARRCGRSRGARAWLGLPDREAGTAGFVRVRACPRKRRISSMRMAKERYGVNQERFSQLEHSLDGGAD